jgi:hypothetical protein
VHWSSACLSRGCRCAIRSRAPTLPSMARAPRSIRIRTAPQLDELCVDIWMTESLTTSCGLSVRLQMFRATPTSFPRHGPATRWVLRARDARGARRARNAARAQLLPQPEINEGARQRARWLSRSSGNWQPNLERDGTDTIKKKFVRSEFSWHARS